MSYYGKDKEHAVNHPTKANQFQITDEVVYSEYVGNIPAEPAKLRPASKHDYINVIRSLEANSPNPASFAVTIAFEPKGSEYESYTVSEFNETVGAILERETRLIAGRLIKKFTNFRTIDSHRSQTLLPFWLLGERFSKHGLDEVRLHLHGRLFFAADEFLCFVRRQAEIEKYAAQEFQKSICPVSIVIKRDHGNFESYGAKHLSKDDRALDWLITNLK